MKHRLFSLFIIVLTVAGMSAIGIAPKTALAADNWQAASDDYFGQPGTISATGLADWQNKLWVGTNADASTSATVRSTDTNFFAGGIQQPLNAGAKTVSGFAKFTVDSADALFVGSGTKVFYQNPLNGLWVDALLPQVRVRSVTVTQMAVFNGYLYVGVKVADAGGTVIFRHSPFGAGGDWEAVVTAGYNNTNNYFVSKIFSFQNYIYAQLSADTFVGLNCGAYIRSADGVNWSLVNPTGYFQTNSCIGGVEQFTTGLGQTALAVGIATNVSGGGTSSNLMYTLDGVQYQDWVGSNQVYAIDPPWFSRTGPFTGFPISVLKKISNNQWIIGSSRGKVYRACILGDNRSYLLTSYTSPTAERVNDLIIKGNSIYASLGQKDHIDGTAPAGIGKVVRLDISNLDNPFPDVSCAVSSGQPGVLDITLPPKEIATPDQLKVSSYTFTFNPTTEQFGPTPQGGFSVTTTKEGSGRDAYYHILVTGFQKGGGGLSYSKTLRTINKLLASISAKAFAPPPASSIFAFLPTPYGYKLTLKQPVTMSAVDGFGSYLVTNGNVAPDHAYVGNSSCSPELSGQFLCLKTKIQFTTSETGVTGPQYLLASLPLRSPGTIEIQGNAGAAGELSGFVFNDATHSIAIGGTIPTDIAGADKNARNYINQNATKFSWTNIAPQIQANFSKRTLGITPAVDATNYQDSTWNLNSNTDLPRDGSSSSFSTPPEGRLWNVNTALDVKHDITFSGSGTIVVNGDVTFEGQVICGSGTRLGILALGKITFNNGTINCGAYTAMGGDIKFNTSVGTNATAKGIFVAKNSIVLPSVSPAAKWTVQYDKDFAANPTVLFQEILRAIFSAA